MRNEVQTQEFSVSRFDWASETRRTTAGFICWSSLRRAWSFKARFREQNSTNFCEFQVREIASCERSSPTQDWSFRARFREQSSTIFCERQVREIASCERSSPTQAPADVVRRSSLRRAKAETERFELSIQLPVYKLSRLAP